MKILIDTDALFGLFIPRDAHHLAAKKLLEACKNRCDDLLVFNIVIQETATVISYKQGQQVSKKFVAEVDQLNATQILLDEGLEEHAWKIFMSQSKKGTSFVDSANLAAMRYYHLDKIFSFDRFYPKELLLP